MLESGSKAGLRTNWVMWSLISQKNSGGSKMNRHAYVSHDITSHTLLDQKLDPRTNQRFHPSFAAVAIVWANSIATGGIFGTVIPWCEALVEITTRTNSTTDTKESSITTAWKWSSTLRWFKMTQNRFRPAVNRDRVNFVMVRSRQELLREWWHRNTFFD